MPRPRVPAKLKKGKSESKEHLDARSLIEEDLRGGTDLVYDYVPEKLTEEGKIYYQFMLRELKASDILSNLDIPILTQMAITLANLDDLDDMIKRDGKIIQKSDRNGNTYPVANPAVSMRDKIEATFRAYATQLGMTPSARSALAEMNMAKQAEDDDPFNQIVEDFKNNDK